MSEQIREHKKIIPLALIRVLEEETDENHAIMMSQLQSSVVQQYGINVDRRTVYATVRLLNDFGYDIRYGRPCENGSDKGYYMASHDLTMDEVKEVLSAMNDMKKENAEKYERIKRALLRHFSRYQRRGIEEMLNDTSQG